MSIGKSSASSTPLPTGKTPGNRSDRPFRSYRILSGVVRWGGFALVLGGAVAILWGSLLPWLTVNVFDVSIALPGVVGFGAATAAIGLLTLTRSRSYPAVTLLLGLLCIFIGYQAQQGIGRQVARQILQVKQRLAPINARLEQVNLPPIEPFPGGVLSRNYVGPGPLWTIWGGVALVTGASLQFAGNRLRRTCAHCRRYWHPGRDISFCFYCGAMASNLRRCERCFTPLEKRDRFCVHCGTPTPRNPVSSREPEAVDIA